jgi:hypothetical protein
MGLRQIADMHGIANAGAIGSAIIGAQHIEAGELAKRGLYFMRRDRPVP